MGRRVSGRRRSGAQLKSSAYSRRRGSEKTFWHHFILPPTIWLVHRLSTAGLLSSWNWSYKVLSSASMACGEAGTPLVSKPPPGKLKINLSSNNDHRDNLAMPPSGCFEYTRKEAKWVPSIRCGKLDVSISSIWRSLGLNMTLGSQSFPPSTEKLFH